jgi:nucleoid DNA-binding protein
MARTSKPKPATPTLAPTAQLKKADLLDQIVARSLLKKREAKPVLDAALALIGEALARGDELMLPPLGKIRVVKTKDLGAGAQVLTLKMRSGKDASQSDKTPLATLPDDD